jgi:hypothetical protein
MPSLQADYFSAYRSLTLTRDTNGVLVVGFHSNGGPFMFVVAEVVPHGKALSRARELAELYVKAPEVTRRNTHVHFMQPLKERIVREVRYGLSLAGAAAADLVKSMQAKSDPVARKGQVA